MTSEIVLTRDGAERLEQELEHLMTAGRQEVAERLRDALTGGTELAENADYLAAKDEQAWLEQRIVQIEDRLANAHVVEAADVPKDTVAVGSRVRIKDLETRKTVEYEIVGSGEGNPVEGRISSESPVGSAILGRGKGEIVEVEAPTGVRKLKVIRVSPAASVPPRKAAARRRPASRGRKTTARQR